MANIFKKEGKSVHLAVTLSKFKNLTNKIYFSANLKFRWIIFEKIEKII
jgi:hypothetical protein